MGVESFGQTEAPKQNNNSLNSREVFDLQGYGIELRNKNERVKVLEDREKEIDNIKGVLDSADTYNHNGTFYISNDKYYIENPLRVNPDPSDIPYLKIISKEELTDRLGELQESLEENNIVEKLKEFDKLISANEGNPNLRAMLIETRIALTGIDETSYLAKSDSLNSFLHLLEKSETSILGIGETLAIIGHGINIARYYVPEFTAENLNGFKDITSAKLFKYGKENAEGEQYMENLILKYNLADSPDDTIVELSKIPPAILAGGIDGLLDFIQSNIELVTAPDKIIGGLIDLLPLIADNIGTLGNDLVKGIESESDVAYIISYAVTVIASIIYINPGVGIFTIPGLVIKALSKFNLGTKTLAILESNLTNNIKEITGKIGNTVNMGKQGFQYTEKLLVRGRNITDSTNTGAKRMKGTGNKVLQSREVLRKLNDTIILTDIFGKNMDKFLSSNENTDIALKVYEDKILKGNGIVLNDLEDMIKNSNGELQYNLLRIRERFDEMEKIFEREVFPLINGVFDITLGNSEKNKIITNYNNQKNILNKLTISIIDKYVIKKN